jgi:energy-coupling factor transport system ATP-binding protein
MAGRVDDALAEAGAAHLADRKLATLSGGERQRVALASVLAMRPDTVVLDEPTSQLDPAGAAQVLDAATRLVASGRAVVMSEHRVERMQPLASSVVTVDGGRAERLEALAWRPAPVDIAASNGHVPGAVAWSLSSAVVGFGARAVAGPFDLAGREGEVVALRGPNGAGKTTVLRTVAGVLRPLAGKVERRPGRVAYLPQNPAALLHRPTVRAEVELTLARARDEASPDGILKALGLSPVEGRYPRDLSTGERQRAALAAVLVGTPSLVLLDEPTRGMDAGARAALIAVVSGLRARGAAIVLATHDTALIEALADRVVDVVPL